MIEYDPSCSCCKLLAHKWMPQIVTVLLSGPHRFSALQRAIPGISDKVLSGRLVELKGAGIITRVHYPEIPPRVEYALTPAGLALEGVIAEMDRWSREVAPRMPVGQRGSRGLPRHGALPRARATPEHVRRDVAPFE